MAQDSCVILSACRTPIGTFGGALKDVPSVDLGARVIGEAMARAACDPSAIDEVVMGCVLQAGNGMNVARQASLGAGLAVDVPAETINRVCGSGLQAVIHAVQSIQCGVATTVVAGGTESMSRAPYLLPNARFGYRMGNAEVVDSTQSEGLRCAIVREPMGITAETIACRFGISRGDQDQFALESQRRAHRAIQSEAFVAEIVPVDVPQRQGTIQVHTDEHPRPDTTEEKLARLKPAFKKDGTVTAGNASGINDGAAAVVVTGEDNARRIGRKPLARILSYGVTAVDPAIMGMGPVSAVRLAVRRAGLHLKDIDLFELNEAFAAQSVAVVRELDVDPEIVNVNGGAIALGHPIGASGARVLTTLIYALRARKLRYGVASLCIGGGMGIAMAVEAN
jgi:acetyl-CoA C-acetyltransferase